MVKHIVMFRLKATQPGQSIEENKNKLKAELIELKDQIPELKAVEVGLNISASPNSYDLVLITVFDNLKDLDIYRNHPEHQKLMIYINEIKKEVAVVDYIVEE